MQQREWSGAWWLPGEPPERQQTGRLVYSAEEFELELLGTFLETGRGLLAFVEALRPERYPVIFGVATTGQRITLLDSVNIGVRVGSGVPTQRLAPSLGLVGEHVQPQDALWNTVQASFRHLLGWFGESGLTFDSGMEGTSVTKYDVTWRRPNALEANVGGARVEVRPTVRMEAHRLGKHSLSPQVSLVVSVDDAQPYEALADAHLAPFQDLLTLATGQACPATHVAVFSDNLRHVTVHTRLEIEVMYRSGRIGEASEKELLPQEMLFSGLDVADRFEAALTRWSRARHRFEASASVLFGTEYVSAGGLEAQFLVLAQAAEVFHRVKFPGTVLPEDEHATRIRTVMSSVPAELRQWLSEELEYSNEPRLRRRLRELYDHVRPAIEPLVRSRVSFVQAVVETRNDLVHRGTLPTSMSLSRLYRTTQALRHMLQACFLIELGFSATEARTRLDRNGNYRFAASLNETEKP